MNKIIEALENEINSEIAYGENGMPALATSSNANLDYYSALGGLRGRDDEALRLFNAAYLEDKTLALANLFNTRDPRSGMGERSVANVILKNLMFADKKVFLSILPLIPHFGRWKDIFEICSYSIILKDVELAIANLIVDCLNSKDNALLAKYIPLKPKSASVQGVMSVVRKKMKLSPKNFRKLIVSIRTDVVEVKMSSKKFDEIEFGKVPSMAMMRYKTSFYKRDGLRFAEYIENVKSGVDKINSATLTPEDVVNDAYRFFDNKSTSDASNRIAIDAQWLALKNHFGETPSNLNIIPVIDVSGSMIQAGVMGAAVGLGIYLSERNNGYLRNYACSFSTRPRIFKISGGDICSKVKSVCNSSNVGYGTNFKETIVKLANFIVDNDIPEEQEPKVILFLSDMNFDESTQRSEELRGAGKYQLSKKATEIVKEVYGDLALNPPKVVFWNLDFNGTYAAGSTSDGFAMVGGKSASQIRGVLSGIDNFTPYNIMIENLSKYIPVAMMAVK